VDWVQWLGLGGVLVAVAAFVAGRRDASRVEASTVYVMVTLWQPAPVPPDRPLITHYQIFNKGSRPALAVRVSAWDWGRRRLTWRFRPYEDWMTGRRMVGRVINTLTPDSSTDELDLPAPERAGPVGEPPPIMLMFRDGSGREWVRWPDGKLTRITPSWFQLVRWQQQRENADPPPAHRPTGD
jgi:hypothetical protein